jgi:potassium efflux system protein
MIRFVLRWSLCALLLGGGVGDAAHPAKHPPTGTEALLAPQAGISGEQAQTRIAELEVATEIDEASRAQLIRLYRNLIDYFETAEKHKSLAQVYRQSIDTASQEAAQVRAALALAQQEPAPSSQRPAEKTAEVLQQELQHLKGELADQRAQLAELDRRLGEEEATATLEQAAKARETLARIEANLSASPAPESAAPETQKAGRAILEAHKQALVAEISMLEQRLLSNEPRSDLRRAQRERDAWNLTQGEAKERRLETWLSELRQAEAERARQEAERLRREALNKHTLIRETVKEIAEIALKNEEILAKIDALRERRWELGRLLEATRADEKQTQRLIELEVSGTSGTLLLEIRRKLPEVSRRAASQRFQEAAKARLQLFEDERDTKKLADREGVVDGLLSEKATAGLSEIDRADLRTEMLALIATKVENLERRKKALDAYQTASGDLVDLEQELTGLATELGVLLDKRLIWIPNAAPLGLGIFAQLLSDLGWFASPELWNDTAAAIAADFPGQLHTYLPVAIVCAALLLMRRRMRARRTALREKVGKVREDGVSLTLRALALHLLDTLALPAAFAFLGWRLTVADPANEAAKAVGFGLVSAAMVGFAFEFVRDLARKNGIAPGHFRWSAHTGKLIRSHLLWYVAIALPATFVIAVTQAQSDPLIRHGLGRVAFIALMLAALVLAFFLLRQSHGLMSGTALERASQWLRRTRPAWLLAGMAVPLALAVMAATGYYYAALELEGRLNQTLLIILTAIFLHSFGLRWLLISQRRLALKLAMDRRAAMAKKQEAGEEEDASLEAAIETLEEIDVAEIADQTRDLLRVPVGLYLVLASWFVWAGVLPALSWLSNVHLWYHDVIVDGVPTRAPITLESLGLALFVLLITLTAGRNMPGFLEIAVLQRLPLEPGARYATRTLVLYAIATTGFLVAFNVIGVGWNSVQWLVAALTVGLGFGLQEIFANFVSGLVILLERPIRVGDTVTVGGTSGVVTRIRMRATTITDWSRRELVVPNKGFITGELINWSLSDPILRLEFPIGIAYGSDTTLAHKTMLGVCREHPLVLDQPEPNVFFTGFGDNSLNFEARVFVNEPTNTSRSRIVHDLHMAIDRACRENDITIAFPQRDLHFKTADAVLRVAVEGFGETAVEPAAPLAKPEPSRVSRDLG